MDHPTLAQEFRDEDRAVQTSAHQHRDIAARSHTR